MGIDLWSGLCLQKQQKQLNNKNINVLNGKDFSDNSDDAGINFNKVVVHAPYIVNLANEDVDKHEFAISFLKQEVKRCDTFGVNYMVLHPGAHVGAGIDTGIKNIIDGLNKK